MTEQHVPGQHNGEASAMPELSRLKMPEKAISLVNDSLQVAFPDDFGRTIPPLTAADIHVVRDESFQAHQKQSLRKVSHSLVNKWTDDITSFLGINLDDVPLPPLGASQELPDRPIMYSESAISISLFNPLAHHLAARLLVHEHMHRVAGQHSQPVTPDNPLFHQAFHTDATTTETVTEETEKNILSLRYKSLNDFASANPSEVIVEGAQVILRSKDSDGVMRRITQSGYDLNEALVELLIKDALIALARDVQRTLPTEEFDLFTDVVFDAKNTAASFRHHNYLGHIKSAVSAVGINADDSRAVLQAYANGDIPRLHASRNPKQPYYT